MLRMATGCGGFGSAEAIGCTVVLDMTIFWMELIMINVKIIGCAVTLELLETLVFRIFSL